MKTRAPKRALLTVWIGLMLMGAAGCIPTPKVYDVRVHAQVEDLDQRVFSVELLAPRVASVQRVVCYGTFTSALLEGSEDRLDDFLVAYLSPRDLKAGKARLYLQEAGRHRLLDLTGMTPTMGTIHLDLWLPKNLDLAEVRWRKEPQGPQ